MLILAPDSLKHTAEANTLTSGRCDVCRVYTHTWKPDLVCHRRSPAHAPASRGQDVAVAVGLGKTSEGVWKMSRPAPITATGSDKPHAAGKMSALSSPGSQRPRPFRAGRECPREALSTGGVPRFTT